MAIQFKVINKGAAAIIPDIISFRLEDTFMNHSSLVFRTAEPQALKFMSKVEVRDGTTPLFMGYISSPNKVASPSEPSDYICSSVSRLLTHRYPVPRTFEAGVMIKQLIFDAIGTTGLLADANHRLNEDVWTGPQVPIYTWYMRNVGTNRYAPPASVYLGSTPLTHGISAAGLTANQWFQDASKFYVCAAAYQTPDKSPYCYWENFKDTTIRYDTSVFDTGLNDKIYTIRDENIYAFLMRMFKANAMEIQFRPDNDGYTYLKFAQNIYHGDSDAPVITYTQGVNALRIMAITLDENEYGFNGFTTEGGSSIHSDCDSVHNAPLDFYFWTDHYTRAPTLSNTQAAAASLTEYGLKAYVNLPCRVLAKYVSSPPLVCGDWIGVSADIGGAYRLLKKVTELKDGKTTVDLTLHWWYNLWA